MGLFDAYRPPAAEGYAASPVEEVADGSHRARGQLLRRPGAAVVDTRGKSRQPGRPAARIPHYRPGDPAGGVGAQPGRQSPARARCCATRAPKVGLRCLGALPRRDELGVPSRHPRAVTAADTVPPPSRRWPRWPSWSPGTWSWTRWLAAAVPVFAPRAAARRSGQRPPCRPGPGRGGGGPVVGAVVAVAGGTAFSFGLRRARRTAAAGRWRTSWVFDPLREQRLGPRGHRAWGCPAVPEEHGPGLGAKRPACAPRWPHWRRPGRRYMTRVRRPALPVTELDGTPDVRRAARRPGG